MTDYARTAVKALDAVLSRSQGALAKLAAGDVDEGLSLLKGRTVAFHNFRASLHQAERLGIEGETERTLKRLADELNALEPSLMKAVESALADTEGLARKLAAAKGKIGRFGSGAPHAPQFTRTV